MSKKGGKKMAAVQHSGPNYHKSSKHRKLLSTEKACLVEIGYQAKCHKVYTVSTGTLQISLLSKQNL